MFKPKTTIAAHQINELVLFMENWRTQYLPVDMFPKPNFELAEKVLKEKGISLGDISASNMRHVLLRIEEFVKQQTVDLNKTGRGGTKKKLSKKNIYSLHKRYSEGVPRETLMKDYDISLSTFYRYLD